MALQDLFAFVNGYARGLVDHQEIGVLIDYWEIWLRKGWPIIVLGRFLKRDIQLDAIAGTEQILGLCPLAVDAQTVFSKELANVADWEPALQETF